MVLLSCSEGTEKSCINADHIQIAIKNPYYGIALMAGDFFAHDDSLKINHPDLLNAWKLLPNNLEDAIYVSNHLISASWIIGYYHCMIGIPVNQGIS